MRRKSRDAGGLSLATRHVLAASEHCEGGLLQWRALLFPQFLFLSRKFNLIGLGNSRLACTLDAGGNLPVQKLIAQFQNHIWQLLAGTIFLFSKS